MFPCFVRLCCVDMAETSMAALPVPLQERIHAQAQETPQCQLFGQGRHSGDRTLFLRQGNNVYPVPWDQHLIAGLMGIRIQWNTESGLKCPNITLILQKGLNRHIFRNVIFDISSH
jgi:hypothetical protein